MTAASRWEIVHTGPRQFHARLVAPNNEILCWTETYRTRRAARDAIELTAIYGSAALTNNRLRNVEEPTTTTRAEWARDGRSGS